MVFETGKSGKPCDKLMAPCSWAMRDMTVKMEVPVSGSRDVKFKDIVFGSKVIESALTYHQLFTADD